MPFDLHLFYPLSVSKSPSGPKSVYFHSTPNHHEPTVFQTKSSPPSAHTVPNHTLAKSNSSEPIPMIEALYSPTFALEEVRQFVMEALAEAVAINQVHNRDPIGGSNETLFL